MSLKIRFHSAEATGLVLAKVGNPQRDEPLQTSREVFHIEEADRGAITALFLKPFKNLVGHRFAHHSSLDQHEMHGYARAIFTSAHGLLEKGCEIARHLYAKSNHPNIKSGDLCIALVRDIEVDGESVQGLCILKAETTLPFLTISTHDGDLRLATEQGFLPEKIDKGCLILDKFASEGHYVLTFDRTGGESRFWVRDFLGVQAVPDAAFLTNAYTDMAVTFLEQEFAADEAAPEEACTAAHEALTFFEEREQFDLADFEKEVLKSPEVAAKFAEHRAKVEEEQGQPLETTFEISHKDVGKARKKITAVLKLDTGVEIHLKPAFVQEDGVMERGFDDDRGMKWIKVWFNDVHVAE